MYKQREPSHFLLRKETGGLLGGALPFPSVAVARVGTGRCRVTPMGDAMDDVLLARLQFPLAIAPADLNPLLVFLGRGLQWRCLMTWQRTLFSLA